MSDYENNVIYRYEPHFEGEFFYGIPARDLTQADVDRLDPLQQRDAFAPHPGYGTPLYVKVGSDAEPPKWFRAKQADAGDAPIEPMLLGETKQQYEERIAAMQEPQGADATDVLPIDPDAPVGTEPPDEPPVLGTMAGSGPGEDGTA